MILFDTLKMCLQLGYTLTVINWLEDDLKITKREDALKAIKPLILSSLSEFNKASCTFEYKKASDNKINKALYLILKHFEDKNKENIEEISENFVRININ
jgi:hypothetical protein